MLSSPSLSPAVRVHHHPIPDGLVPYIERATIRNLVGAVGMRWQLVPTGCVGFTVRVGDPANGFDLQDSTFESWGTSLLTRSVDVLSKRDCIVLAVSLTPLAITRMPMEALALDQQFAANAPGSEIFSRGLIARLYRLVRDAPTVEAKMDALLQWFEHVLFDGRPAYGRRLAIGEVTTLIHSGSASTPSLADAARRVGVSLRQLERDFQRYLTTTPRRYTQVAKVQQMAQLVWQGHSLADTAAALGFADQAHMTRLVRDVTGLPPAQLLQRARASPFARATGTSRTLRLTET
jgi:AraC-like DNA-binding protein